MLRLRQLALGCVGSTALPIVNLLPDQSRGAIRQFSAVKRTVNQRSTHNTGIHAIGTFLQYYRQFSVVRTCTSLACAPFAVSKLSAAQLGQTGADAEMLVAASYTEHDAERVVKHVLHKHADTPVILVLAFDKTQDSALLCSILVQMAPAVIIFTQTSQPATPPGTLAASWQSAKQDGKLRYRSRELIQAGVRPALAKALHEVRGMRQNALVCVCGTAQLAVETEQALQDPALPSN